MGKKHIVFFITEFSSHLVSYIIIIIVIIIIINIDDDDNDSTVQTISNRYNLKNIRIKQLG